jgi:hypothetical protein
LKNQIDISYFTPNYYLSKNENIKIEYDFNKYNNLIIIKTINK